MIQKVISVNRILVISVLLLSACSTKSTNESVPSDQDLLRDETVSNENLADHIQEKEPSFEDLQFTRNLLQNEITRYQDAYEYLKTDQAEKYFVNGSCSSSIEPRVETMPPVGACETEEQQIPIIREHCEVEKKCDLVSALIIRDKLNAQWDFISGLGCSYSNDEQTLLTQTGNSMSAVFCAVGPGKIKNKYINIFRLGRSAACAYSLQNIVKRSDRLASCMTCLLYTSPSPRDLSTSRMPSSA